MRISKKQKIVITVLAIVAWTSFVSVGSFALFKDTVMLTDNTITTGTAELLISNSQNASSTIYEEVRPGFSSELLPGESFTRYFIVKNASDASVPFDLSMQVQIASGTTQMHQKINLEIAPVDSDGNDIIGYGPLFGTVQTFANTEQPTGVTIPKGATQRFRVTTLLNHDVESQSDSVSYHLVVNGTQSN